MSFKRITEAAERAEPQFSPVHGKSTDNRDVLKELALEIMRQFTALVEEAGADASYIQPYEESLVDDLNYAFAGEIERAAEARLDHRFDIVLGAKLGELA